MKNAGCWNRFMRSGKVEDYLRFRSGMQEDEAETGSRPAGSRDGAGQEGEDRHGGSDYGDGHDTESVAGGRL